MDKATKLDDLIDGAEELLTKLADAHNPDIQRLRDRVDHAISDARRAIARQGEASSLPLREIASTVDDFIRDYPWIALLTGMLVAGTVCFVAGSVAGASKTTGPIGDVNADEAG